MISFNNYIGVSNSDILQKEVWTGRNSRQKRKFGEVQIRNTDYSINKIKSPPISLVKVVLKSQTMDFLPFKFVASLSSVLAMLAPVCFQSCYLLVQFLCVDS